MPARVDASAAALALGAVLAAAGSGCLRAPGVPDLGVSPARPVERALYSVDWWTKLVPDRLFEHAPRELGTPALDPESGRLLVGTRDGVVRSVGEGGVVAWTFTARGPFEAGPTVADGVVYAACADGKLYALDARTGAQRWQYDTREELVTQPLLANGKVLVAASSDVLFAVNAGTGEWAWQYRRDTPSGFTIRGASRPTVRDGVAFTGFSDGWLVALHVEDGSVKWERMLSRPGQYRDVDTAPVLGGEGGGDLYAASYKDGVFALDTETGGVRWQTEVAGLVHLIAAGQLIVGAGDQEVAAFDRSGGKKLWELPLENLEARSPALTRGFLLVPASEALLFVNPVNGRTELTWDPGQGVSAMPLVRGQKAYILSNLGFLYALDLGRSAG